MFCRSDGFAFLQGKIGKTVYNHYTYFSSAGIVNRQNTGNWSFENNLIYEVTQQRRQGIRLSLVVDA